MKLLPTGSRAAAVAICVSGLLAYHNSLGNSFHYDDSHSLVDNPHLRSLGNTLRFFYDPGTFSAIRKAARLEIQRGVPRSHHRPG